jgi:hypothetical protein
MAVNVAVRFPAPAREPVIEYRSQTAALSRPAPFKADNNAYDSVAVADKIPLPLYGAEAAVAVRISTIADRVPDT